MFGGNGNHSDLSPLGADRIPKRNMRGSPCVEFTGALPAWIDIGKGGSFSAPHDGELERKVAFLRAIVSVVNPAGNQAGRNAEPFKKLDLLRFGGKPVQTRMFQDKIK